ncbi:MAG: NAD-dependent epimerase/dehydratase family protein [Fervidicoccaceae archaeon]
MKVLVAGGAGFLGREVAEYLLRKGYDVFVLDPLADSHSMEGIKTIRGKIGNIDLLKEIGTVDYIVHAAWNFSEDLVENIEENLIGTEALCRWGIASGVKRLVFYSSSVIYGVPTFHPISEDHPLLIEKSRAPVHALMKLYVEKLLMYYHHQKQLPVTIFRIWWAFSNERAPGKTYREILSKIKKEDKVLLPSDSGGSIVYTDDLSIATEKSFELDKNLGEVFNISSFYLSWKDVLKKIAERYGSRAEIIEVETEWKGPAFLEGKWLLDDTKLRKVLGITVDMKDREEKFIDVSLKMMEKL